MPQNVTALDYLYMGCYWPFWKLKSIKVAFEISENAHDLMLFRLGLKRRIKVKLKSGKCVEIKDNNDYATFWSGDIAQRELNRLRYGNVRHTKNVLETTLFGKRMLYYYNSPKIFGGSVESNLSMEKDYNELNVKGRDVVDIGAYIGDTAIGFVFKGAKHVYAFEPFSIPYAIAVRNVRLNKLSKNITVLKEACGCEPTGSDLCVKPENKSKVTTLYKIVHRYGLHDAVLKLDCEGCEYNLILNSDGKTLRAFKHIFIEYHHGYLDLKRKLVDEGFIVKNTRPKYTYNGLARDSKMYRGYLFASLDT